MGRQHYGRHAWIGGIGQDALGRLADLDLQLQVVRSNLSHCVDACRRRNVQNP
jgi:hypothetical protein